MVPGVSMSSNAPHLTHCLLRVTPALSPVTARFAPDKRLMTVLLPVFGTPAMRKRSGRFMPFSLRRCAFSEATWFIAAMSAFLPRGEVASRGQTAFPASFMAARSASALPRSHLLRRYRTGRLPAMGRSF